MDGEKMGIFRTYDIRGVYPTELNEEIVFKIGKAFGTFNPGKIVVGNDARLSGPSLKEQLIKGLISTDCDVIDVGMVTTPMIIFSTKHLKCDGGMMVTASHNPKEFNGLKFNDSDAIPISYESGLNQIQKIFNDENFSEGKGKVEKKNITQEYSNFLLSKINIKNSPKMKIVVDAGNASPGAIYPKVLEKIGIDVYELYCNPDGNFPNHQPDPTKQENMIDLQKKVLEQKADLGIAFDGDGDRLGVVDKNGKMVGPNNIFALLIKQALTRNPNSKVVYDALSSMMIEDIIKKYNGIPVVSKVGHTYITQRMIKEDAILAGELSGHYYFKEILFADDALFAALRLIEFLTNSDKYLNEHFKDLPKYYSQVSEGLRVPINPSEKISFIENLKRELTDKGYEIDTLDGVKILFDGGWALFRAANTESKISVAYEAKTEKEFEKIKKIVEEIVVRIPK
jgi:phosphomannomutase/phosphoglucomutase